MTAATIYRAAHIGDAVLTGPEHAGLSDEDLMAEARAECARANIPPACITISVWNTGTGAPQPCEIHDLGGYEDEVDFAIVTLPDGRLVDVTFTIWTSVDSYPDSQNVERSFVRADDVEILSVHLGHEDADEFGTGDAVTLDSAAAVALSDALLAARGEAARESVADDQADAWEAYQESRAEAARDW